MTARLAHVPHDGDCNEECFADGPHENAVLRHQAMALNERGQWVPSIPLPLYGLRKQCQCGRRFWTTDGYNGHYSYAHVLYPAAEDKAA